ncbi:hydrogenase nickel incorporation protein HypA [Maioricimonas rarisocia]|uniref:Hydrogenase nickel incorporation protein HypA n=1 Tax=Maioricimonas rarisocia TaxID=2528026 RepID=A0A517Z7Y8_9PLAN|nr:hypothetical protein [Maioricimonas rarisocia]QDU38583.1 hydrogenase nickel incorporation protein HypA [Maioricimonas rarisocia]
MKVSALNCPNCGAALQILEKVALANCGHCSASVVIEWPDTTLRRYVRLGLNSPFVRCPLCAAQQLCSAEVAELEVACHECGEKSIMPQLTEHRIITCRECGRMYSSVEARCPDHERHDRF